MKFGIRQDDDLVTGLKFGVAADRYQARGADDDAHPDISGVVTKSFDCASLGSGPRGNAQAMDPLGFVLQPDSYLPWLRLDGAHGQAQEFCDTRHRAALHQN